MRIIAGVAFVCLVLILNLATDAQPPGGKGKGKKGAASDNPDLITYMMSFNKAKDGKLTRAEFTDTRLVRLFERADADKDGVVTRQELEALVSAMAKEMPEGGKGPGVKGPRKKE